MKTCATLLLALALAGCETPKHSVWIQENTNQSRAKFDQDFKYCEARNSPREVLGASERNFDLFGACMRAKGWRLR